LLLLSVDAITGKNMKIAPSRFVSFRRSIAVNFACAVIVSMFLPASYCATAVCDDVASNISIDAALLELNEEVQTGVELAKPACVAVSGRRDGHAGFSAVIVGEEGYVLTAAHCIQPDRDYFLHLDDGRTLKAKSLGRSDFLDVGLMRIIEEAEFPYVEMGRSGELVRNQPCLSISHPGGLNKERGLVIRYGRVVGFNGQGHIHNTCLMEPGDSGGGLFDLEGRLIGIHSYIHRDLSDNFDMPVDHFHNYWEELCEPKEFTPPYAADCFGIRLKSDTAAEDGAEITSVVEGSPADEAGLQADDVILTVNEKEVIAEFKISQELQRMTRRRGRELEMTVLREDQNLAVEVNTQLPKSPEIVEGGSNRYGAWTDLALSFSPVEEHLDDMTVQVISTKTEEETPVIGTVVGRDGLVVTKASRVGDSPVVTDSAQRKYPAEILGRDEENDLMLLRVNAEFEQAVDLNIPTETEVGLLLSPRPGEENGFVSVLGSARFQSALQKQYGYLGVMPGMQDERVVLTSVPEGPAKKAELKQGDVILGVDEVLIDTVEKLVSTLRSYDPGELVLITFERDAVEESIEVALGTRPQNERGHVAYQFAGGGSARRTGFEKVFCHDAHAEPADCGGPLFNIEGKFIGLNIARYSRTHCYALPSDIVRESVNQLLLESQ
jgi:serine protease Do